MRKTTEGSDGTPIYTGEVSYDDQHGLLASFSERMGVESGKHITAFTYDEINRCTKVEFTSPAQNSPTHNVTSELDGFSRVTKRSAKFTTGSKSVDTTYTYAAGANGGSTSSRVSGITVKKNNSTTLYAYVYNLQGDVVALTDSTGAVVVEYGYDAWGKPLGVTGSLAGTLGAVQSFRYRGYVWDEETGLYYLRSRYYNPGICRFVNEDSIFDENLFEYCYNTPTLRKDPTGNESISLTKNKEDSARKLASEQMSSETFVELLKQTVGWKYRDGYAQFGYVDCVGLHKYIFEWYYDKDSFSELCTITKAEMREKNTIK